jgi:uncharacterized damage-inducible protein DinB
MSPSHITIQHFEEIRCKSIKLWSALPEEYFSWRPDTAAFSCLQMVRHVLETENIYHVIVNNRGGHGNPTTPWTGRPFSNIQDELDFAMPLRGQFMNAIRECPENDFNTIKIVRSGRITRTLGEFLFRCIYHESVHTGQFLSYMRAIGLERPNIWD